MSVAIFSLTPYINKWQMSLCNNSSDNKSYWIHRVDVKVSVQVTTVTYMHQSQPSLHSLRKHLMVHLELWPGNHLIWCNATYTKRAEKLQLPTYRLQLTHYIQVESIRRPPVWHFQTDCIIIIKKPLQYTATVPSKLILADWNSHTHE